MVGKMKKLFVLFFILFLSMSPVVAQEQVKQSKEIEVIARAWPEPYVISHNIVFVVDASSTINRYSWIKRKFDIGWDFIVQQFAKDELYFRVYAFHDVNSEKRTEWIKPLKIPLQGTDK